VTIIKKSLATQAAKERIAYTLRTHMQTYLDALTPSGVELAAPADDAIFLSGRRLDRELLGRHPVLCIVETVRPSVVARDLSAVGEEHGVQVELPIRVRIVFAAPVSYTPRQVQGKLQSREEHIEWQALLYQGAVIDALHAHVRDNASVQDILLESDWALADVLPETELEIGGSVMEWTILQTASVPMQTEW
jgi:hypothetical protein